MGLQDDAMPLFCDHLSDTHILVIYLKRVSEVSSNYRGLKMYLLFRHRSENICRGPTCIRFV